MIAIPAYIDADLWQDFIEGRREMQKSNRVPFTAVAQKRILMKLMKMHDDGHDANQALEDAICNSWRSVFAPRVKHASSTRQPQSFANADREAAMLRWEEQTGDIHPDRRAAGVVIDMTQPKALELWHGPSSQSH